MEPSKEKLECKTTKDLSKCRLRSPRKRLMERLSSTRRRPRRPAQQTRHGRTSGGEPRKKRNLVDRTLKAPLVPEVRKDWAFRQTVAQSELKAHHVRCPAAATPFPCRGAPLCASTDVCGPLLPAQGTFCTKNRLSVL